MHIRKAIELDPTIASLYLVLAEIQLNRGQTGPARESIEKAQALGIEGARVAFEQVAVLLQEKSTDGWELVRQKASGDSYYDDTKDMELLTLTGNRRIFDYISDMSCPWTVFPAWSEPFRELRGTPEFLDWMERAGAVEFWEAYGWPDDCESVYGCPN